MELDERGPVRFTDIPSTHKSSASFDSVRELVAVVASRMEASGGGRRFPLLHVVDARRPLSGTECEALVWEIARLRTILSTLPVPAATDAASVHLPGRTLADVHEVTLSALDVVARLGATSRRGARFGEPESAPVADRSSDSGPARDSTAANSR